MHGVKTWLVVNSASGGNEEDRLKRLVAALEEQGVAPDQVIDVIAGKCPDAAMLDGAGVGLLAIFAGDGTINSVLLGIEGWCGKVLVLPGGTANLLARALHGERDECAIVAALSDLATVRRKAVRCEHGVALIELLAGPGAKWSDVRESLRDRDLAEMVAGGIDAVQQSVSGPDVAIVDPALGDAQGYAGIRMSPQDDAFKVAGYGAQSFSELVRQGMALLRRDYREGPHDDLGQVREIVCESRGGEPIELMIDGERQTGAARVRFSLVEVRVDLLAARA